VFIAEMTIDRIYMLFTHGCSGLPTIFPHKNNPSSTGICKSPQRVLLKGTRRLPWNNSMLSIYHSCEKIFLQL